MMAQLVGQGSLHYKYYFLLPRDATLGSYLSSHFQPQPPRKEKTLPSIPLESLNTPASHPPPPTLPTLITIAMSVNYGKRDEPATHFLSEQHLKIYRATTKEATVQAYSEWAPSFDTFIAEHGDYVSQRTVAEALLSAIPTPFPRRPLAVLDVCCGTGLAAQQLLAHAARYGAAELRCVGFDFSAAMLREAAQKALYERLFLGDIHERLDADEGAFDLFVACGVFVSGHVEPEAIANVARCVKAGGLGVITVRCTTFEARKERFGQAFVAAALEVVQNRVGEYLGEVEAHYIVLRKLA